MSKSVPSMPAATLNGSGLNLRELRAVLHQHLHQHVLPFWTRHALDPAGGINTCIADDGTLLSQDKWLWSQWRAVWIFSTLAAEDSGRSTWWQELARQTIGLCAAHGWLDDAAGWALLLDGKGRVLEGHKSLYTDGFAIYGLAAYLRLQPEDADKAEDLARRTADAVITHLRLPHDRIPHHPYPVAPHSRMHGLPMMFSLSLWELGQVLGEPRYRDVALGLSESIFSSFYRSDRDLILERIGDDDRELPPPLGTAVVPGHVIEDMWFQIHIARDRNDEKRIAECCRLIRRHLELGWDQEHGGLLLAVDADGRKDVGWDFADAKLWWPHTEALYALLLAYAYTGQRWCLDWYAEMHEYTFRIFPHADGEWAQKFDRRGEPLQQTVALPVKDPFHLPRALLLSIRVLDQLIHEVFDDRPL